MKIAQFYGNASMCCYACCCCRRFFFFWFSLLLDTCTLQAFDHSIRLHMNYAVQDEHLMCLTHEATLFESLRAQYICSSVYF